jgi:hypothetical protein
MERFRGFQKVDVTTAYCLLNPKNAFKLTHELNTGRKRKDWISIELYPIRGLTSHHVNEWQKEYPNTHVNRVHLPFSYNSQELLHRAFLGERENGITQQAYQLMWLAIFGTAVNKNAIMLAKDLHAGITVHPDVIEGFRRNRKLNLFKDIPVYVENERPFKHPILDTSIISDPLTIIENLPRWHAQGLLWGVDHCISINTNLLDFLYHPDIREYTYAIHIAGPHHGIISGQQSIADFLEESQKVTFAHSVGVALDIGPGISHASMKENIQKTWELIGRNS